MKAASGVQIDIELLDHVLSEQMGLGRIPREETYESGFVGYELRGIPAADAGNLLIRILKGHEAKYGEIKRFTILPPNLLLLDSG